MPILAAIRIRHWIKNLLVFIPTFFAGTIQHLPEFYWLIGAFFSFCFAASAVYVFNDLMDISVDRLHPVKKKPTICQ